MSSDLREAGSRCGFTDVDREIKHQIVFACTLKKLRRKALTDDPSLTDLIKYARSMEKSITQAKIIEDKSRTASVNNIGKPGRYSQRYESKRNSRQPYDMDNQRPEQSKEKLSLLFLRRQLPAYRWEDDLPSIR